jgi:hypothetical protein
MLSDDLISKFQHYMSMSIREVIGKHSVYGHSFPQAFQTGRSYFHTQKPKLFRVTFLLFAGKCSPMLMETLST